MKAREKKLLFLKGILTSVGFTGGIQTKRTAGCNYIDALIILFVRKNLDGFEI